MPAPLPAPRSATGSASSCPRRASTASAWSSCPPTPHDRAHCEELFEYVVREEGQDVLGWRDRADRQLASIGPTAKSRRAGDAAGLHRPAGPRRAGLGNDDLAFERKLYVIRKLRRERGRASPTSPQQGHVLRPEPVVQDAHLQGHAQRRRSSTPYFPDLQRPGHGVGPGAGPLALQHQHLPDLGPRPPVPLLCPQRRDQHAARQRQLDARPREHVRAPTCSATTSRRSCRSSTRAAATRPCSTTPWNCWS